MKNGLKWENLLAGTRARDTSASGKHRNPFDLDYDRIVGSSSVRRLQDKAQVFPLQENDFTRTRLTHSLEVSALAKSLGKAVGLKIAEIDTLFDTPMINKLESLLQTVGLVHDLGNPPFGHYGETIIRNWFSDWFFNSQYTKSEAIMSDKEKKDFLYFDGNVQNLRILTKLQMLNDENGVNFTYATLATLMKYPWESDDAEEPKSKFGYYQSEKNIANDIWNVTGLNKGIRHPATFLLEAADDIIYTCDDIEDGVKKGKINWEKEFDKINQMFSSDEYFKPLFSNLQKIELSSRKDIPDKITASVSNFRNVAQGFMFTHVVDNFMSKYSSIMNGEEGINELLEVGPMSRFIKHLKNIAKSTCFNCNEVLTLELAGDKVIKGLLDIFVPAVIKLSSEDDIKLYPEKIYHIISPNFRYIACFDYKNKCLRSFKEISVYEKFQLVVDYISGMTDSYAVNLYKELTGYKLP